MNKKIILIILGIVILGVIATLIIIILNNSSIPPEVLASKTNQTKKIEAAKCDFCGEGRDVTIYNFIRDDGAILKRIHKDNISNSYTCGGAIGWSCPTNHKCDYGDTALNDAFGLCVKK
ncbi:MAG: hypothetical protein CMI53_02410 [Parcubacteria group bacterium]|nr:hypothetical protein [Parcubacteria group bacterium]|tara:strand:- start:2953 stop:3309 length:357 start_codon:yes stop_codon:yes gene_type:complete